MKKLIFSAYIWLSFLVFSVFLIYFSEIENLETAHSYSKTLESITYFFGFGFASTLLFRALVYTMRFSVDRLSVSRSKKEREEDDEFRLIVEILLIFLTIAVVTSLILINHIILKETEGRNSDIYAILINTLGVSIFSFLCFMWPFVSKVEEKFAKKLL